MAVLLMQEAWAQPAVTGTITIIVNNDKKLPLQLASVSLHRVKDSAHLNTRPTNTEGKAIFRNLPAGNYFCNISMVDYLPKQTGIIRISDNAIDSPMVIQLQPGTALLQQVVVSGRKSLIKVMPDKTIVQVDNGITNTGASVLEVLEKSPGVSIDRDGNIALKGKPNVLILIDGKPTYVSGSDLSNLLGGMNASNVESIELMDNPPARYDAAGNGGVINIRTKRTKQQGFNGSVSTGWSQGKRRRSIHSLSLNYRQGKLNTFLSYNGNEGGYIMDLYALRRNFSDASQTVKSMLSQPTRFDGQGQNHTLKAGVDYAISSKTTLGVAFSGFYQYRKSENTANAQWLNKNNELDSVVRSTGTTSLRLMNGGVNLNLHHQFNAAQELNIDLDYIGYDIQNNQYFENQLLATDGYVEAERGFIPTNLKIFSGKADYACKLKNDLKLDAGWKSSRIRTDNTAGYRMYDNGQWVDNLIKSNHFIYTETIHAAYTTLEKQWEKFSVQAGLRYELTGYDANQLGNAVNKDSAFSRNYNSLFPTVFFQYKPDSNNSFSLSGGRRIDRPAFQKLNPFVFIINKYTFQKGNPFLLPQYTWNLQLSHQYKDWLLTSLSYSRTKNFFSQIFLQDDKGLFYYTDGNAGHRENFGLSVNAQTSPWPWWSMNIQTDIIHKRFKGFVWKEVSPDITQISVNINNQFKFKKGWNAELTATYITRNQDDLQEIVDPTGQVGAGISKLVLKNKATIKLAVRDIFYSQKFAGNTDFPQAQEYFSIKRDSRVGVLTFTWRFGKAAKGGVRRSGSAEDEMQRAGSN